MRPSLVNIPALGTATSGQIGRLPPSFVAGRRGLLPAAIRRQRVPARQASAMLTRVAAIAPGTDTANGRPSIVAAERRELPTEPATCAASGSLLSRSARDAPTRRGCLTRAPAHARRTG
jgi:hypothetical protein